MLQILRKIGIGLESEIHSPNFMSKLGIVEKDRFCSFTHFLGMIVEAAAISN